MFTQQINWMKANILILLIPWMVLLPLGAQAQLTAPTDADLAEQLDAMLAVAYPADGPGAAVLVLRGGEVILRKGYGLGYFAMAGGRAFDADLSVAWPGAEICAMNVEGAVDVAYRNDYLSAPDPQARRNELITVFKNQRDALRGAEAYGIDDVIDPRHTRRHLIATFNRCAPRKQALFPPRFRSINPM